MKLDLNGKTALVTASSGGIGLEIARSLAAEGDKVEINVMSGVRLARHYLRGMLGRGHGRVVFISSESGVSPAPEMAHYSATKTMQLGISRSLAELTKHTRVTVNSVLPGPTRTESVE